MIIKTVTAKGDAIPMTAAEAVKPAIVAALKTKNTLDHVYWANPQSLLVDNVHSMADKDGNWEGWAKGSVAIGKTRAADDKFFEPKMHKFDMHYKLGKNDLGMPDVKIESFAMSPIDMNPTFNIGDLDADSADAEVLEKPEAKN